MKAFYTLLILLIPFVGFGQGWTKTYGYDSNEEGYSVLQTDDGGYVITGYTYYNTLGGKDVYIIKTDEFGFEQWSKKYGGDYDDNGRSIKQTNDGGYIVIGDIYNINSLTAASFRCFTCFSKRNSLFLIAFL